METERLPTLPDTRPTESIRAEPETAGSSRRRGFDLLAMLLLLAGVCAMAAQAVRHSIDLGDEGFLAHSAQRVLNGELPHRDFYSLQGPLSSMFAAAWSAVAGLGFLKLRVLGVLLHAAMVLLAYRITRRIAGGAWALAAALIVVLAGPAYMHFAPLAVWQAMALSLASIALAMRSVRRRDSGLAFLSGLVAALAMLVRHDLGTYSAAAIVLLAALLLLVPATRLAPGPRLKLGAWLIGAASVSLPALAFFAYAGALPAMYDQLVLFPLTRYGDTSAIPMPSLNQAGPNGSLLAVVVFRLTPLLAVVSLAAVAIRWRRKGFGESEAVGLFLAAWALLFHAQVLVRSDLAHLVLTMPPVAVLLAWLPGYAVRAIGAEGVRQQLWRKAANMVGACSMAVLALVCWHLFVPRAQHGATSIDASCAGTLETRASAINGVLGSIAEHSEPGDALLALPYHPAYYVLADRRNPTRWGYHWPGDRTDAELKELIAQAQSNPPRLVVIFDRDSTATFLGPVVQWVETHYTAIDAHADPVIYRQRNEASLR